ncbi:MAG: ATP-binding cassette domain-containing protein [Burkholderiaceae bacterium]|nr:ATP-binding cassette domain-containing protein [Burkholderiaceae bacterium]
MQAVDLSVHASGKLILHCLNFEVRRGEVLAIVGASGSGKSTLLRHLMGLATPASGHIDYHGVRLHSSDAHAMAEQRRKLGVMFQNGALWSSMSVGDNIALPLRLLAGLPADECARRARHKLSLVGLTDAHDVMPAALSGGMRKRAALARALALDPDLLLLDEPGSGLDPVSAAQLDGLIEHLQHDLGTTIVMVTHDMHSVFSVADRMLFIDENDRTMTALAPPNDLLAWGPERVRTFLQYGRPA